MEKIELEIVALSHSVSQSHSYAVVLGDSEGARRLPIVIGGSEAQAIAVALESMVPSRPLTHDLTKNILETFDVRLDSIVINNLVDGIFYAQLVCYRGEEMFEIDSRTSDALALAVRFKCKIFTYEFIMEAAGVDIEEINEDEEDTIQAEVEITDEDLEEVTKMAGTILADYSTKELQDMLNAALAKEDYERAARIRDELNKRT